MPYPVSTKTNYPALYSLVIVFFFWGFVAASNGVFIPFCKQHFQLSQFESQLIDLTFYGGYFIGSMLLFVLSQIFKKDFINQLGYKKGIVLGIGISILGTISMIPSLYSGSFSAILLSFFVIALGFSLQQTCAQPFAIALGSEETGSHRLNFAGGVNSLGTTLAPLVVSFFLFGSLGEHSETELENVVNLYYILAGVFVLIGAFLYFSKIPDQKQNTDKEVFETGFGALKYPQLVLGMIAIFLYVGVEVSIQSNFGALLKMPEFGGLMAENIAPYISLYWGSLMIGRWAGAISAFKISKKINLLLGIIIPFLAFSVVLLVNSINSKVDMSQFLTYIICIIIMIISFRLGEERPAKTLLIFSILGVIAMTIGLLNTGKVALFAFISGGLVCSIMWPCIFSMATAGLGKYKAQGSGFLIMMILGGALIPPLQGYLADAPSIGIHASYIIPVLCFAYLAYFAIATKSVLKKQNINIDELENETNH